MSLPRPLPVPTGYMEGRTYYRPVLTVEGTYVYVPVCHRCGSQHEFSSVETCLQALAERIAVLEKK